MQKITRISGTAIPVRGDDIDTDRIIPARFMKELTFDDLGQYAFYDARRNDDGTLNDHAFNDSRFEEASVLLVNRNFGCGSSREHAPQALIRSGIKAVVGESFAEIFAGNCTANGVPIVMLTGEEMAALMDEVEKEPGLSIVIDLEQSTISAGDTEYSFIIEEKRRQSLLDGSWDTLGEMLDNLDRTRACRDRLSVYHG